MTNATRVTGPATAGNTKRLLTAAVAAATKRLTALITADNTRRFIGTGALPASIGGDTWGGSWGRVSLQPTNSWGRTWSWGTIAVAQSPAADSTGRVAPHTATAVHTARVARPVP
jgi:hypothetical protein